MLALDVFAGDPQGLLHHCRLVGVLDHDHLDAGLLLQLADGLSTLADHQAHLVAGHHDLNHGGVAVHVVVVGGAGATLDDLHDKLLGCPREQNRYACIYNGQHFSEHYHTGINKFGENKTTLS